MIDPLLRIAEALDRMVPPAPPEPRQDAPTYQWTGRAMIAVHWRPLSLSLLTGIDDQRDRLVGNFTRHARGVAAHDAVLWGARGSGKSALVNAAVAAVRDHGHDLVLIAVAGDALATMSLLFDRLSTWSRPVIVFLDDLAFDDGDHGAARMLRSLLDGGATARPAHVRLAVTSNRRHLVPRAMAEQSSVVNVRDVVDDRLALVDRFGLNLGFHVADQTSYLAMVDGYARHYALAYRPADAVQFAAHHGSRSGRVAWHYIVELAGQAGRAL